MISERAQALGLLSEEEVTAFERRGFVGPFRCMDTETAIAIGERIRTEVQLSPSAIYAHTVADPSSMLWARDRQLDSPLVHRACTGEQIVGRVVSLLGPDVLLWRSDVFMQSMSDAPTALHQDLKFTGKLNIPGIDRADGGMPLNVTAWLAFTPMSASTGALRLVPGSNGAGPLPLVKGEGGPFGKGTRLEKTYGPDELHTLDMEPGEFVLFDNLTVHGASPILSESTRVAISIRFVSTAVRVNPRGTQQNGHSMELSRFGSLLVSGIDRFGHNVLRSPPSGIGTVPLRDERSTALSLGLS